MSLYYEAISSSASHIYLSAFGLLPHINLLKRLYVGQVVDCLRVLSGKQSQRYVRELNQGTMTLSLSFSPNGTYLASFDRNSSIYVWHTATATLFASLEVKFIPQWIQFLPDNTHLVCISYDNILTLWDASEAQLVQTTQLDQGRLHAPGVRVRYATDRECSVLGCIGADGILRLWDTGVWYLRQQFIIPIKEGDWFGRFEVASITSSKFTQATHVAAVLSPSTLLIIHILPDSIECQPVKIPGAKCRCLSFSPDGRNLAVGTDDGRVFVWDTETSSCLKSWVLPSENLVKGLAFNPTGTRVIVVAGEKIIFWRLRGTTIGTQVFSRGEVLSVWDFVSSNDGQLALASGKGISLPEGDQPNYEIDKNRQVTYERLTLDGTYALGLTKNGFIHLLNTNTGETYDFPTDVKLTCALASSDSGSIVAGTSNGDVLLYWISVNLRPRRLYNHPGVISVGFSQGDTMVLSGSASHGGHNITILVWDLQRQYIYGRFSLSDLVVPNHFISGMPVPRNGLAQN